MIGKTFFLVNVMLVVLNLSRQFQVGGASSTMQQRAVRDSISQNRKSAGKVHHVHRHYYHSFTQEQKLQKSLAAITAKLNKMENEIRSREGTCRSSKVTRLKISIKGLFLYSSIKKYCTRIYFIIQFCKNEAQIWPKSKNIVRKIQAGIWNHKSVLFSTKFYIFIKLDCIER